MLRPALPREQKRESKKDWESLAETNKGNLLPKVPFIGLGHAENQGPRGESGARGAPAAQIRAMLEGVWKEISGSWKGFVIWKGFGMQNGSK